MHSYNCIDIIHDVERLIATLSISGELIVSRYVAESITTDAGHFGHVGLCQLRTKLFCTQLTKAYVAETSCISCYWFCYVSAHDQFARDIIYTCTKICCTSGNIWLRNDRKKIFVVLDVHNRPERVWRSQREEASWSSMPQLNWEHKERTDFLDLLVAKVLVAG